MRDILIHEYFGVDLETVWETVKTDIPSIKPLLVELLNNIKKEHEEDSFDKSHDTSFGNNK